MEISINGSVQQSSSIGSFSADSPLVNNGFNRTISTTSPSTSINIDDNAEVTAPFIQITEDVNQAQQSQVANTEPPQVDSNRSAVNAVDSQRRDVLSRKQSLSEEQRTIAKEILKLEKKEAELALKKLQLQQESSVGNLVNLSV